MSEHLLEVFKSMPTEALIQEHQRVAEGIALLIHREELIEIALEERYASDPISG